MRDNVVRFNKFKEDVYKAKLEKERKQDEVYASTWIDNCLIVHFEKYEPSSFADLEKVIREKLSVKGLNTITATATRDKDFHHSICRLFYGEKELQDIIFKAEKGKTDEAELRKTGKELLKEWQRFVKTCKHIKKQQFIYEKFGSNL